MVLRTPRPKLVNNEVYEIEQWFDAPIVVMWGYFTDAQKLSEWHGGKAELDVKLNGLWRCEYPDGAVVRGEFLVLDAPHHLVYTWGFERHSDRQLYDWAKPNFTPPGQSLVDVTLTESEGGTRVSLHQSNFAPGEPLADGWPFFLDQLTVAVNERQRGAS